MLLLSAFNRASERLRSGLAWGSMLTLVVLCLCGPRMATAAGCHYAPAADKLLPGGVPGTLATHAWWTVSPVKCQYVGGRFTYFQLPSDAAPCHGPSCRGSSPEENSFVPCIVESQRQTLYGDQTSLCSMRAPSPADFCNVDERLPLQPILSGPLRPPRS